jgi:hypothetical protein
VSDSFELEFTDEATVAAYLSKGLDSDRAQAFEAYCLSHPDFARQVELDLFFKVGMKQQQEQEQDKARRAGQRRRIGLALAAGLTLIVGCGLLLLPRTHLGTLSAYRAATEVPAQLLAGPRVSATLIRLRGDSVVRRVVAPRGAGVLRVRVAADSPPGRLGYAMGVALEPRIIPRSVTLDNLHADADGYIEMYLPLSAVAGQTLRVTVASFPPMGEAPLSFRLQVAYPQNTPGADQ